MKEVFDKSQWAIEYYKCKEDPYYFATTYLTVNGQPFTTRLSRKKFNAVVRAYEEFREPVNK